jgi:hypothetical protein
VGATFQSAIRDSYSYLNGGSGIVIDSGGRTGRTNIASPGTITLENVVSHYNEGSGFVFGNPNDDPASIVSSLRIVAINCESLSNDCDVAAGVAYEDAEWYIRGDHHTFISCAATASDKAGTPNDHVGVFTSGRTQRFDGLRILSSSRPIKVGAYTGSETNGIIFDGIAIRSKTATEVVEIDPTATNISVRVDDPIDNSSALVTPTTISGLSVFRRDIRKSAASYTMRDIASTGNLVLADDAAASIEFSATGSFGIVAVSAPTTGAKPSIVAFRVGSSNYCSIMAGSAAATTGVLAGTTGADATVTFSTDSGDNKFYIENRSGASRTFRFTFLSMQSGTMLDASQLW